MKKFWCDFSRKLKITLKEQYVYTFIESYKYYSYAIMMHVRECRRVRS